jgi:hypothetical protein
MNRLTTIDEIDGMTGVAHPLAIVRISLRSGA